MTYAVKMRRSPDITEEEVRRRLAACYSLLLELARKRKCEMSTSGGVPVAGTPAGGLATEYQESNRAESRLDTDAERDDRFPAH
jgi:hypothetical protein